FQARTASAVGTIRSTVTEERRSRLASSGISPVISGERVTTAISNSSNPSRTVSGECPAGSYGAAGVPRVTGPPRNAARRSRASGELPGRRRRNFTSNGAGTSTGEEETGRKRGTAAFRIILRLFYACSALLSRGRIQSTADARAARDRGPAPEPGASPDRRPDRARRGEQRRPARAGRPGGAGAPCRRPRGRDAAPAGEVPADRSGRRTDAGRPSRHERAPDSGPRRRSARAT